MKNVLLFVSLFSFASCNKSDAVIQVEPQLNTGPVLEAEGSFTDYSAVDGCNLLLSIPKSSTTTSQYALSDESVRLVKPYIVYVNAVADVKATVRYQLTGRTKGVFCGWASSKPFDEITILSINPH
ncbi:hypothetical protein [Spirosoma fluviale]|uniref:Uncharacterized protein n=1 Tax=Spirosoma fluviale TaxID=1597977 RepID=A0A286GJ83_9BACT|nr:hypothetical protein [Spirosoma fluviale]SOD95578.1 hypothetical protein SAMN06269250_4911 [Spirosoma fluviale]